MRFFRSVFTTIRGDQKNGRRRACRRGQPRRRPSSSALGPATTLWWTSTRSVIWGTCGSPRCSAVAPATIGRGDLWL